MNRNHVPIERLTCCLNMDYNLTILKMSPDLFVDITWNSIAARTDYVNVFVLEKTLHGL